MAIITISREMGSGGIPIAHAAAEKLGYTLIDGEAIANVAEAYGLTPESLENADEKPPAFVESIDEKLETDFHRVELIILDYALKGNIIIYGRGGQDLLKDINSVLRVRIIAPLEERVERWAEREWLDPDLARVLVRKSDQQRAGFIKYYFDRDWADPLHYDLTINTSRLSEETAVKLICEGVRDRHLTELKDAGKKVLQDLILAKKIEIKLLDSRIIEGLHHYHFHLAVKNGIAAVSGHVHSKEKYQAVLAAIREIDGIKGIDEQLEIRRFRSEPEDH